MQRNVDESNKSQSSFALPIRCSVKRRKMRPPKPLNRPKLAEYLWRRDIAGPAAAAALGRTRQWLALVLLPFDDPRRRVPDLGDLERIHEWTEGEITPADFYPPELQARPAPAAAE